MVIEYSNRVEFLVFLTESPNSYSKIAGVIAKEIATLIKLHKLKIEPQDLEKITVYLCNQTFVKQGDPLEEVNSYFTKKYNKLIL